MKCSASPTTSPVPDVDARAPGTSEEREAVAAFEAMLSSIVMKPLADTMGPLGGFLGDAIARARLCGAPER